ncbi:MAG: endolytic transglycosylase MltG [Rhodobacteraceae bacterium]|nr:endolytic transglycosylase MltG [Paracoccaceae bacterium]
MRFFSSALVSVAALLTFAGGVAVVLLWVIHYEFRNEGPTTTHQVFSIAPKTTFRAAAHDLAESDLITSALVFRFGARLAGNDRPIQTGSFFLPARSSMQDILDILTAPDEGGPRYRVTARLSAHGGTVLVRDRHGEKLALPESDRFAFGEDPVALYVQATESDLYTAYSVSIIEGLTSWQIVEGLKDVPFLDGEISTLPAEGSLAPDTYYVLPMSDPAELIARMTEMQTRILEEEWSKRAPNLPLATPADALILASIIEKETGVVAERAKIASVFVNRLHENMRLQADPTVIYGVTEGKRPLDRGLRKSELRRDFPHNTYVHKGLPPTPIANPGRMAIHAALNPADSSYYYFVADGAGGHAFAESYAEHQVNVAAWRKLNR